MEAIDEVGYGSGSHLVTKARTETAILAAACSNATIGATAEVVNLSNILGIDGTASVVQKYLPFGDLRSLSVGCKSAHSAVRKHVSAWPPKVRELLRTYCNESSSILTVGVWFENDAREASTIVRLSTDVLGYDGETKKLIGEPWSLVCLYTGNSACFADDDCSQVFECGMFGGAALFDTKKRARTSIPSESMWHYPGMFRVGSKIYVLGGTFIGSAETHCYDLGTNQWVDAGIATFPGNAIQGFATVVLNERTVIVAGGWYWTHSRRRSQEVFALNTMTGLWTEMPDLPESLDGGGFLNGYCVSSIENSQVVAVIMGEHSWASLVDEEWVVTPDLRGSGLKAMRNYRSGIKLFVGDGFIDLPDLPKLDRLRVIG